MKSSPLIVLAAVLALVLALLTWLLVGLPSELGAGGPSAASGAESAAAADDVERGTSGVEAPVHAESHAPARTEILPGEAPGDVDPALEVDLSLRGRLVGPDGRPCVGAVVRLDDAASWLTLPLAVEPSEGLRDWRKLEEATTDAEGRFAFADLDSGTFRLEARDAEHLPLTLDAIDYLRARGLELGDLTLERGCELVGRVVDERGQGLAGVTVLESLARPGRSGRITVAGRGCPVGTTGADGRFRLRNLEAGATRLIFDSPRHVPTEVEAHVAERPGEGRELLVHLESGFALEGRVEGLSAERLAALRVVARRGEPDGGGGPRDPIASRPRRAQCDAAGCFRLEGLAAGALHRLTAYTIDEENETTRRVPELDPVYARPGDRDVVLGLKRGAALALRVVDAETGAPVERVLALAGVDARRAPRGVEGHAHPGGVVRFDDVALGDDGAPASLELRAAGYAPLVREGIALEPGETLDLGDVALERAPRLVVRVTDAATGSAVTGAIVACGTEQHRGTIDAALLSDRLEEPTWNEELQIEATDERGVVELEFPGETPASVVVAAPGYAPHRFAEELVETSADVELHARLTRGGSVTVLVEDELGRPVHGATVLRLRRTDDAADSWVRMRPEWKSDASGRVRFEALEVGRHGFRVHEDTGGRGYASLSADQTWTDVEVVAGGEGEIALRTFCRTTLHGTLREAGRPLVDARLNLVRLENGEPADRSRGRMVFFGGSSSAQCRSDAEGVFRFEDVRAGEYLVRITHGTRYAADEVRVDVGLDVTERDIDLSVASIEGRVTEPDGSPVAGVRIQAGTAGGLTQPMFDGNVVLSEDDEGDTMFEMTSGDGGEWSTGAVTDSQGRYVLRGVRPEEETSVSAEHAMHAQASHTLEGLGPDEVRTGVDFVLAPAGVVELRIASFPEGAERIECTLVRLDADGDAGEEADERSTNLYPWTPSQTLESLPPGRWTVRWKPLGGTERVREVRVTAGERTQVVLEP